MLDKEWFKWLFGGLGASIAVALAVALLSWIISLFWKKQHQKEPSINISNHGKENTGIALNDTSLNNSPVGNIIYKFWV